MPNQSDPVSLTAPVTGIYYVQGGFPKFYNGTAYKIQLTNTLQLVLTGTFSLTTSASTVVAIPANSAGQYFLFRQSVNGYVNTACAVGQFVSDNNSLFPSAVSDPKITITSSGLNLQAEATASGFTGTYTYLIVYYTP